MKKSSTSVPGSSEKERKAVYVPGVSRICNTITPTASPETVEIVGSPLPSWIHGTYLRTGPGMFDLQNYTMHHLFDGYAILTRFQIQSDKVTLTTKYLQSDAYKRALAAGQPVITEFATGPHHDPHQSVFSRLAHTLSPEFTDNNSSNVAQIGQDYFVLGDTCFFYKVDPDTLRTYPEKYDTNKLFSLNVQCSHPIREDNGDVWNVGYTVFTGLKFHVFKIPNGSISQTKIIASVPSRWTGCMASAHSFGVTENFIVLVEQPFVVCATRIAGAIIRKDAVKDWMSWREEEKTRFILIHKSGRVCPIEYYSDSSFHFFHIINSFEEADHRQIVIDITSHRSPDYLDSLYVSKLRKNTVESSDYPEPIRFRIPLLSLSGNEIAKLESLPENTNLLEQSDKYVEHGQCTAFKRGNVISLQPALLILDGLGLEMSSISSNREGKSFNFLYSSSSLICPPNVRNRIVKYNLQEKKLSIWRQDEYTFPVGEPLFVPNPEGNEEDDGILICPIISTKTSQQDFLLFLNKDLKEIARASFTHDIPLSFHTLRVSQNCPSATTTRS